jgi:hypothetical protein
VCWSHPNVQCLMAFTSDRIQEHRGGFLYSLVLCTSSTLVSLSSSSRISPFVLTAKHITQTSMPATALVSKHFICTFSVLLRPGFAFCPYCTTHTIQTSMPLARFEFAVASDTRLKQLGHLFFLFVIFLFFFFFFFALCPYIFLCLDCPAFCFSLDLQHTI